MVPTGTPADDPRVVSLIFEPGFSTRDTVSELSGRGVGLDVVRDAVRALRGSVAVESTPGKGTAFIFRLPLTLALIDGLLVETAGGRYVVPLAQVEECVALNSIRSALAEGRPCVAVRGELVPMVSLAQSVPSRRPDSGPARIVTHAARRPAGRRRRRSARGPRPGGHPVAGRRLARPQPLFGSHDPGGRLRLVDPRSISPGVRIKISPSIALVPRPSRREGGELPMRISLINKITTALVLFGLIPASIVAWFAYSANDDFKRQARSFLIKQAAASISDHIAALIYQNPKKPLTRLPRPAALPDNGTQEDQSSDRITIIDQFTFDGRAGLSWSIPTIGSCSGGRTHRRISIPTSGERNVAQAALREDRREGDVDLPGFDSVRRRRTRNRTARSRWSASLPCTSD